MTKQPNQPALLPQHQDLIEGSGITSEVASRRGYRSITRKADLTSLGFGDRQLSVPGLLVPVWGISGDLASYQFRPDNPRIGKNGKPIKYETPSGTRMVLDALPSIRKELLDPHISLSITEGVRKADAAISNGICCVALLGVWNWRGTNEFGGKTALPDFESIALNDRQVYIAFDSDVVLKPAVHAAMSRLKGFLERRGAQVSLIYLPEGKEGEKVGLDDFLAAGHSPQELFRLASPQLRALSDVGTKPDLPYEATDSGIIWKKPVSDGTVDVKLTNFKAQIVSERVDDDGVETRRSLEIDASLNGQSTRMLVSASQFAAMNWPVEHLGANAVVYPGFGCREHTRVAIQLMSTNIQSRKVYTHTGWREIDGSQLYLSGGATIGANGVDSDVEVDLPTAMDGYCLPEPPMGEQLRRAICASMKILDLAPETVTFPIFAAIWRAILGGIDFSLHISGRTGTGKSEIAALVQQHWGPSFTSRNLPASWSSTGNALEGIAFYAKDAVLVVDDFCPTGSSSDVQKLHREADRLFRAQGNNSGRQRMRSDATLRSAKPPRGLIISTGEDIPKGHSLRSRLLVLETAPGDVSFVQLTHCQKDAATGLYAAALAGFVGWVAPQYTAVAEHLKARVLELRQKAGASDHHRRTPEIVANLMAGMEYFAKFACQAEALTMEQARGICEKTWKALGHIAMQQRIHQGDSDPTHRFIALLRATIASGRAHIVRSDGSIPEEPGACGWRFLQSEWRPSGDKIGWIEGDNLYLEPEASYGAVQQMARNAGDSLAVTSRTLHKLLREGGLLCSTDRLRKTITVRRVVEGSRIPVLHLHRASILPSATDHSDHCEEDSWEDGQSTGQSATGEGYETDLDNCPSPCTLKPAPAPVGSLVSLQETGGESEGLEAIPKNDLGKPETDDCEVFEV